MRRLFSKQNIKIARPGGDPAERLIASKYPEWQPHKRSRTGHRSWRWQGPDGTIHTVGCGSGAHSKHDAEQDAQFLDRRIKKCISGACDHIPSGIIDESHLSDDPGSPLIRAGEQVTYNGIPYWISDIAGGIVSLIDQQGNEEVAPASDLGKVSSIMDPVRESLDPRVWDDADSELPTLKKHHKAWIERQIHSLLKKSGYRNPKSWLSLVFTGSLTTYQYSDDSDVDISLFIDSSIFPDWVRADMIAVMVEHLDGTLLPGTPFPMQCFVVAEGVTKEALYQSGLRSGYDIEEEEWIVPPERDRAKDIKSMMAGEYAYALEVCDKMERLLRYEPSKAILLWSQVKKKRREDHKAGKGDFALSNIVYKALSHRGLFPKIENLTGVKIALTEKESSVPPVLYHWTDANNLSDWVGDNVVLPHGIYMTSEGDVNSLHPDVPISENPVRIQIDATKLDPSLFGYDENSGEGYLNGEEWGTFYYMGRLTPDSIVGWDKVKAPEVDFSEGDELEFGTEGMRFASGRTYSKWVYDAIANKLAVGEDAAQEGETLNHEALMRKFGLDPASSVFGWVRDDGQTELFGRPALTRGTRQKINDYEAQYKAQQAVESAYGGLGYAVSWLSKPFEPSHNKWDLQSQPQIEYIGNPPSPNSDTGLAEPEPDLWSF